MTTLTGATPTPTVQSGQVQPGPVQSGQVPASQGDEAEDIVQRSCLDIFCCCFSGRNVSEAGDLAVIFDAEGGAGGGTARIAGIDNPIGVEGEDDVPRGGAGGAAAAGVGGAVGGVAAGPSTEGQAEKDGVPVFQKPGMEYLNQIVHAKQEVKNAAKILLSCSNRLEGLRQLKGDAFIDGFGQEGNLEQRKQESVRTADGNMEWKTTIIPAGAFVQLLDVADALTQIYPKKSEVYRLSSDIKKSKLVSPLGKFYLNDLQNDDQFNVGMPFGRAMMYVHECVRVVDKSADPKKAMKDFVESLKRVLDHVHASCKHLQNTVEKDDGYLKESETQK